MRSIFVITAVAALTLAGAASAASHDAKTPKSADAAATAPAQKSARPVPTIDRPSGVPSNSVALCKDGQPGMANEEGGVCSHHDGVKMDSK